MCITDEKNTSETKSTKFPFEGKCFLPKLDPCTPKIIRPAPVDLCPRNKYIPSCNPNKRIQPASTAAAAASMKKPSFGSTIPSDTPKPLSNSKHLDPPMIIPCIYKDATPPSQLDHLPNDTRGSTEKKVVSEPKPYGKDNIMLAKKSGPESKLAGKDTGSSVKKSCSQPPRPCCKDTSTIIQPPKRNPYKTAALAAAALVGGFILYQAVLKDYIMGVPECECGCNRKK